MLKPRPMAHDKDGSNPSDYMFMIKFGETKFHREDKSCKKWTKRKAKLAFRRLRFLEKLSFVF